LPGNPVFQLPAGAGLSPTIPAQADWSDRKVPAEVDSGNAIGDLKRESLYFASPRPVSKETGNPVASRFSPPQNVAMGIMPELWYPQNQ